MNKLQELRSYITGGCEDCKQGACNVCFAKLKTLDKAIEIFKEMVKEKLKENADFMDFPERVWQNSLYIWILNELNFDSPQTKQVLKGDASFMPACSRKTQPTLSDVTFGQDTDKTADTQAQNSHVGEAAE